MKQGLRLPWRRSPYSLGSFVVNLYIPVGTKEDSTNIESARENLYRKGLIHLMKSLSLATCLVEENNSERFLEENKNAEVTTSANLLEATDDARGADDYSLEFSVEWAPIVPAPSDIPPQVIVTPEHSASFRNWSKYYRLSGTEMASGKYKAEVVGVTAKGRDETGVPFGDVKLKVLSDVVFRASAKLAPEEFKVAIDALINNRFVSFRGKCERSFNKTTISNLSDFQVELQ